jgi:hypothetical protein
MTVDMISKKYQDKQIATTLKLMRFFDPVNESSSYI